MRPTDRLTASQAATQFGLPKGTVHRWYSLGHLKDFILDEKGHRLYLGRELADVEQRTRHHHNSRRSKQQIIAA